jgi:hypothetical protein
MFIHNALEQFNPITDEIPRFMHDLDFIARRAGVILYDWDEAQIMAVAEKLDWMFYEISHGYGEPGFKSDIPEPDEITADWIYHFIDSPVAELYERRHQIDISQEEAALNADWSDYFAVLSLAYIAQAATAYNALMTSEKVPRHEATEAFNISNDRILAVEAITYAEFILELKQLTKNLDAKIEAEARNQLRQRNSQAAKQRHAAVKTLKQQFIDYYHADTFPSKRKAAEQFYTGLPEDEKLLLAPTNAVRTLTDALRDYEKHHPEDEPQS